MAFSPIELYLAGFIPADEVPDLWVALDGHWLNDEDRANFYIETGIVGRPFRATQVRTYTIEDIIAQHGPRVPSVAQSQKHFRAAVVHLIDDDHPTTSELINQISKDVSRFASKVISENGHTNFYKATGGRGTITMDGLSQAALESVGVVLEPEDSLLTRYDDNDNGRIDRSEAVQAILDYHAGKLSLAEAVRVILLYHGRDASAVFDDEEVLDNAYSLYLLVYDADDSNDIDLGEASTAIDDYFDGQLTLEQVSIVIGLYFSPEIASRSTREEVVTALMVHRYDLNDNGGIEKQEALEAIDDYLFGGYELFTKATVLDIIEIYLFG